jgi:dephospho-CoA kinase
MILGLTGGMGGGKSTAALFFEEAGYRKIDSDALVRDRVLTDPRVTTAIGGRFPDVLDETGRVQRAVLAGHVFADDEARLWLEDLIHPRLFALWRELLASAPEARWVIEVPLLFEKGLENWFDFIVCVATSSPNQLARLKERGIPQSLAVQRISKQLPLAQKLEKSDFVLSNDGTSEALRLQVVRLVGILTDRL